MRKIFLTVATALTLYGCALSTTTIEPENPVSKLIFREAAQFETNQPASIAPYISSGEYVQRASNLFVLFDASSSATEDYAGENGFKVISNPNNVRTKLEVQREILHRMNKTMAVSAPVLKMDNVGVRSLGYGDCEGYGDKNSHLHQKDAKGEKIAFLPYSPDAFDKSIDTIRCAHGRSHLAKALDKDPNTNFVNQALENEHTDAEGQSIFQDMKALKGKNISLVIVSDLSKHGVAGLASSVLPDYFSPNLSQEDQDAIRDLRTEYGNQLCIYSVWMSSANKNAEDPNSSESEDFSDAEWSYSKDNPPNCNGDDKSPPVFNAERVSEPDGMKEFMKTVLLSPVPKVKDDCSLHDSDHDGVNDCDDKCPNTLPGTPVNKLGCWIVDVKFDNDKSNIKPQYYALLDQLAKDISTSFPTLKLEVQGHTSSTASAAYNMRLSIRRANAVAEYLNKRITSPNKLVPRGYGLTRPIDTNATAAGRANNRRVQLEVLP